MSNLSKDLIQTDCKSLTLIEKDSNLVNEIKKNKIFQKKTIILSFLDLDNNIDSKIVDYFENYRNFLSKNSLNSLLKGVFKP